jgi:hypothetical protein
MIYVGSFQVFEAAVRWVKKDMPGRKGYMEDLLKCVRLPLLSPHYLADTVAQEDIIRNSLRCRYVTFKVESSLVMFHLAYLFVMWPTSVGLAHFPTCALCIANPAVKDFPPAVESMQPSGSISRSTRSLLHEHDSRL